MPVDAHQSRPKPNAYRSMSSDGNLRHSNPETSSDSPSNTPPSTSQKAKGVKPHLVGTRLHTRIPSHGKALHKLTKAHVAENHASTKAQRRTISPAPSPENLLMKRSGSEPKLSRDASTTSLKNSSQAPLKRNRSHAEVKRPRSAGGLKRSSSQPGVNNNKGLHKTIVHFDLGNDGQDDGWTEASGSASPELSRSRTGSVGGHSSGKSSAKPPASTDNSQPHSPATSSSKKRDWTPNHRTESHPTLDAHQITSRLLQRTPSLNAPPQMSSVLATATALTQSPELFGRSNSTLNGTPRNTHKDELSSRFVGTNSAPGTPGSTSPFLSQISSNTKPESAGLDSSRRAKSTGNLNNRPTSGSDSDERPLAPRNRNTSRGAHAYNPPQQSRTQRKLWLQRASSNIEPTQMAPGAAINGLGLGIGMQGIRPGVPLVGAGDDGRDPRMRLQLERTGLEYLVVRRYQDPVGRALKRLEEVPDASRHRWIPSQRKSDKSRGAEDGASQGRSYGLSQSLGETRSGNRDGTRENGAVSATGTRSSYEHIAHGSSESDRTVGDDDGVSATLRSLWEKNFDVIASED